MTDLARVVEAVRAFEEGQIVVVTDDDDRENEGDLILAAEHATPEKIAFIIRHTSGIVCTPITAADARRLHLQPMVAHNEAPLSTAFTVTIDYREGLTTGISAEERCNTVRAILNPNVGAEDFVRPGHIFPLIARDGGVLMRSGHTEAAIDLCRLADLKTVGVLSELVNDDGTVMRGPQVTGFAEEHGLKVVSVAELIAYRQRKERLVERVEAFEVDTPYGPARAYTYSTPWDPMQHLAVVFGDISDGVDIPVRLHLESVVGDVFGRDSTVEPFIKRIAEGGRGIVVYLREGSVGVGKVPSQRRAANDDEGHDTAKVRQEEWREIGLGAQILTDLEVHSIRLLASRERHYVGLGGFDIVINETEIVDG
ncbi:3,4-dihydroxy-2-butanone-4-phosphate synthase [Rhodobium gokarnense]|uniref:3,4-dihydroxy-2-butanone 4-phosphate synthase n=1 Tax=Rhodobium gokarnense TaxID=364296 RepID=A0ABT3H9R3_9HYPH|nr:3,4-dihydroxy-2-butanone-4-phosphate synthase [Rhodobium gokarnense]MCW2307138.1 3,4-dihydroxy 2-butanone 4-phosphate synthase/GTP cyclohydrolase II [Rhodobium gokarnense]